MISVHWKIAGPYSDPLSGHDFLWPNKSGLLNEICGEYNCLLRTTIISLYLINLFK